MTQTRWFPVLLALTCIPAAVFGAPKPRALSQAGRAPVKAKSVLDISVPCGLAGPYGEIARLFQARYPGVRLRPAVNGIVALNNQLRDGKMPTDVFLALGTYELTPEVWQVRLVEGSLVKCATIPLALAVRRSNPAGIHALADLVSPNVKAVSTYAAGLSGGHGARQALEKANVWDAVVDKVVTPKVPDEAKHLLRMGKVDATIMYRTCLMESYQPDAEPVRQPGILVVQTLPQDLYDPISVGAVTLKTSKNQGAARAFSRFLATPAALAIWKKWGFGAPAR